MTRLRERLFQDNNDATPVSKDSDQSQIATKRTANAVKNQALSLTGAFTAPGARKESDNYTLLKRSIHRRLVESIDISRLIQLEGNPELESAISETIAQIIGEESLPLSQDELNNLAQDVLHETLGLGPLEPLLADPDINDILVNGHESVWVDRNGVLQETDIKFSSQDHLLHVINRIVARVGRRVDESSPIVDARLQDGSRVNAIIPPLSLDGPVLSIRRFRAQPFHMEDLIERKALSEQMAAFMKLAVSSRLNILISGGTSAGKTTLLNVLSENISHRERIVTIEDTAELRLQQRHVIRLESRPANIEGTGAIAQRELVKNALRMRPDRIIVGEVRGGESLDMLQAMNTGHDGSLSTVHANSPRDALSRIETLVLLAGVELSQQSIREQIAAAFDLVIQIKRMPDGVRKIVSIAEVTGVHEGVISLQELYKFRHDGTDSEQRVLGKHISCGLRPMYQEKFEESGVQLETWLFNNDESEAADS